MISNFSKLSFAVFSVLAISYVEAKAGPPAFEPAGQLEPHSGSGVTDETVYYPQMRFPIERTPAYANSQVYRPGGMAGGNQCSSSNYDYPWRDNFCETRSWKVGACPTGKGHQGQDIRPATCKAAYYWAVAAEGGIITTIGSYSLTLQTPAGTLYRYLHLDMKNLAVSELDQVAKGQQIGRVSNDFGGAPTTIHLHFDIKDTILFKGKTYTGYVPPYSSLIASYKKLISP